MAYDHITCQKAEQNIKITFHGLQQLPFKLFYSLEDRLKLQICKGKINLPTYPSSLNSVHGGQDQFSKNDFVVPLERVTFTVSKSCQVLMSLQSFEFHSKWLDWAEAKHFLSTQRSDKALIVVYINLRLNGIHHLSFTIWFGM